MPEAVVTKPDVASLNISTPEKPKLPQLRIEMDASTVASKEHPNNNKDVNFYNYQKKFCAVFDGVGGGDDAQEAARIASQVVYEYLRNSIQKNETQTTVTNKLKYAFRHAKNQILSFTDGNPNVGVKSTCAVFFRDEDGRHKVAISSIGDNSGYIFHDGILEKTPQTQSNSWQNPEESNPITITILEIQPGDTFLLSTDGVHDNLTNQELQSIFTQNYSEPTQDITKKIISQSVARSEEGSFRSKPDDMTALVVKISEPEMFSSSPELGTFLPKIGDHIKIEHSSGVIEPDWQIHYINYKQGFIMVDKSTTDSDGVINSRSVKVDFDTARLLNTPVTPEYITQVKDFSQLNYVLDQLDKIEINTKMSSPYFRLKDTIEKIRMGRENINNLSNTYGLRDTVARLLKQK